MNLFENAKATARLAGNENYLSLADGRCKGKFTLKEGKTTVSSAITEKKCGRLTAAYVKASVKGGCFDADTAVSFIIPSLGDIEGYMANFQSCPHWCRPQFGDDLSKIPNRTQALLYKKTDGKYGFILPIVDKRYKAALRGNENGAELYLFANVSDLSDCDTLAAVYGEATSRTR